MPKLEAVYKKAEDGSDTNTQIGWSLSVDGVTTEYSFTIQEDGPPSFETMLLVALIRQNDALLDAISQMESAIVSALGR